MGNSILCNACGKLIPVGDKPAGTMAKCPSCGQQLRVPSSATASTKTAPPSGAPPDTSQLPVGAKTKPCLFCGGLMAEGTGKCPACGFDASSWNPVAVPEEKRKASVSPLLIGLLILTAVVVGALTVLNIINSADQPGNPTKIKHRRPTPPPVSTGTP